MTLPPPPTPLDRPAVARAAAAALDGATTWADAFAALGLRPPPPATLAVALPRAAGRAALTASFASLAAEAAAESASRSAAALPESLFEAAWVAAGGPPAPHAAGAGGAEAGGAALAAAAARAGLGALDLPPRLKRARAPADLTRAAAAGGGVPYAAFRAALLADGS